jgi:leader peptidase (prepilin peptidase)/N-methyltransferase
LTEAPASIPPAGTTARPGAAIAGGAAVGATFATLGLTGEALVAGALISVLVVLAVIDLEERVLPSTVVLPAFAAILLAHVAIAPDRGLELILASAGTAFVLLVPAVVWRGAIGFGDVRLGLLLGAGLGTGAVQALLVGLLAAWPFAGYLLLRDGRAAARTALPLAPFLAFGAIVAVLL